MTAHRLLGWVGALLQVPSASVTDLQRDRRQARVIDFDCNCPYRQESDSGRAQTCSPCHTSDVVKIYQKKLGESPDNKSQPLCPLTNFDLPAM